MKLNIFFYSFIVSCCVVILSFKFSDEPFLDSLIKKLDVYNQQIPEEKIYLHLDKPFYKPGEDIWFKVYLLSGTDNKPSLISDLVTVELINPKGGVEKKVSLLIKEGSSKGDFQLEEALPGGVYKIRAYSEWMKNNGEHSFFQKDIQIQKMITTSVLMNLDFERKAYGPSDVVEAKLEIKDLKNNAIRKHEVKYVVQLEGKEYAKNSTHSDSVGRVEIRFSLPSTLNSNDGTINIIIEYEGRTESISRSVPIVLNKIDLQFFPEGGTLILGVQTKIAFKALNEFGKPADIEGVVLDNNGKTVQTFKSFHQGVGAFYFTAEKGTSYIAKLINPKGVKHEFKFPMTESEGFSLAVDTLQDKILKVSFHAPSKKQIHLVAQIKGIIYFSKSLLALEGRNKIDIPVANFPIGVAQVTLFDDHGLPRCERLAFVNKFKKLTIKISTDKDQYLPREKVNVTVKTTDEDSLPVPSNLSLSVVDDKLISFADDRQDNILSYLLMSADLKGKIEEPSFYFKKDEPKADMALDYLLMTQGWRRFTWIDVLKENIKIYHRAEKVTSYEGKVLDSKKGHPVQTRVVLVELTNKKRVAQLKTRKDGTFVFNNVDASGPVQIFAKGSIGKNRLKIIMNGENNSPAFKNYQSFEKDLPELINEELNIENGADIEALPEELDFKDKSKNIAMALEIATMDEVVVTGYSTERKKDIMGSVAIIQTQELSGESIENLLQGRAPGVSVQSYSSEPGAAAKIRLRGTSSIVNSNPLIVVDGVPIGYYLDDKLSSAEIISPNNISNVQILKGPSVAGVYGRSASEGVIYITTKNPYFSSSLYSKKPFSSVYILPRSYGGAREFYSPVYASNDTASTRSDFRSTLYWNPQVATGKDGTATLSFYNSDEVSAFRVTAEGLGLNGLVGREEYTYFTELPFSIDVKIPPFLTFGDVIQIPVFLKNNTKKGIVGQLEVMMPPSLKLLDFNSTEIAIQPEEAKTIYVACAVLPQQGKSDLKIQFKSEEYSDVVKKEIEIYPKGFPVEVSFSGKELDKVISFNISDPLSGSLKADFRAYPDILGDLVDGIESIIREPYGCFEQTSASTYPNILALQYLRESGTVNKEVEEKALHYIQDGYKKLIGFETSENGFEWYGGTPPHEGLTAFGLMEFLEMSKVYDGVSPALIERTKHWLLSRRKGNGSFKQNQGKYGFSAASLEVNNSYLVYALSEAGVRNIEKEYEYAYEEVLKSKDAYRMALLANASFNFNKPENASILINHLLQEIKVKGIDQLKVDHSIVISYGHSLQVETASLIALALLKGESQEPELLNIMNFLVSSRSYGGFGSTQATILALKTLTEYAKFTRKTSDSGNLIVYNNDKVVNWKSYEKGEQGQITFASLEKGMDPGMQKFRIAFTDTKEALPYTLNVSWTSLTPNSSKECKIDLKTTLSKKTIQIAETVRLTTILTNKMPTGQPMTVAIVGIPSGLSPQPWQLKELQEKRIVDFYEVRKNYVIFYYRELAPEAIHTIHLDLKAEIPGTYMAPASCAYLYYTNEYKDWEAGEKVVIMK